MTGQDERQVLGFWMKQFTLVLTILRAGSHESIRRLLWIGPCTHSEIGALWWWYFRLLTFTSKIDQTGSSFKTIIGPRPQFLKIGTSGIWLRIPGSWRHVYMKLRRRWHGSDVCESSFIFPSHSVRKDEWTWHRASSGEFGRRGNERKNASWETARTIDLHSQTLRSR